VKFLVDNQLPLALARFVSSRGHDCEHVLDIDLARESDIRIWTYANENERVIISKDENFFYMADRPGAKARLVWVRLGNCRTSVLLDEFGRLWPRIVASLEGGERVVEIRQAVHRTDERAANPGNST
jgi:predicted nuclease of predicted toxin-antitoxin system